MPLNDVTHGGVRDGARFVQLVATPNESDEVSGTNLFALDALGQVWHRKYSMTYNEFIWIRQPMRRFEVTG